MEIDWSEAPGWATKYGCAGSRGIRVWYNLEKYQHADGMSNEFRFARDGTYSLHQVTLIQSRPKAPEVEWDKDLPDIGAERQYYNSEMNEVRECTVIAHRHGCAVVEDQDGQTYEAVPPNSFIRTKEQRQREELAEFVGDLLTAAGWEPDIRDAGDLADAILSRYNLGPKDA